MNRRYMHFCRCIHWCRSQKLFKTELLTEDIQKSATAHGRWHALSQTIDHPFQRDKDITVKPYKSKLLQWPGGEGSRESERPLSLATGWNNWPATKLSVYEHEGLGGQGFLPGGLVNPWGLARFGCAAFSNAEI